MKTAAQVYYDNRDSVGVLNDWNTNYPAIINMIEQGQREARNEAIEEIAYFTKDMAEWGVPPESIKNAILDFKK